MNWCRCEWKILVNKSFHVFGPEKLLILELVLLVHRLDLIHFLVLDSKVYDHHQSFS